MNTLQNSCPTICVDSSLYIKIVTTEDDSAKAQALWEQWESADVQRVAPTLFIYEVASALRTKVHRGILLATDASQIWQTAAVDTDGVGWQTKAEKLFTSHHFKLKELARLKTILLEANIVPDGIAILKNAGYNLVGPMPQDTPERRKVFAECHAVIIGSAWQMDDAQLEQAPNLQVVGRPGIGIDNVNLADCTKHGVCVIHTPDAPTQSTAEHAFTLLLACAKQIVSVDQSFRARGWNSKNAYGVGVELKGKTLGLVGLGRIGGTVAKMAQGFDMQVIVFDPYITDERAQQVGVTRVATMEDVFKQGDFISLHSALTPQTRGMVGKRLLELMKPTAFLINCSRGPVIDEPALITALQNKRIAGAGLDVFDVEPTPDSNPLLQLPNVVVSPHIASRTYDGVYQMGVGTAEEIVSVLSGVRPRWLPNAAVWERRKKG